MPDTSTTLIPERLGSFYLGSGYDLMAGAITGPHVNYDARDLTTHAVCVGMTGSGKTGLCVGLLEEAAIDRIPAIIIDPKGDMGNLLLHFPDLRPEDFRPWINVDDARRKDVTPDEFAASTAKLWNGGLADWGIGSERIRTLARSVEYAVYTPGSESVRPVNVLGNLRAPTAADAETLRDAVAGTVGALLGLVGINADPVKSQEAIFLTVLLEHFWARGQDVDLGLLVRSIQDPPVRKFGVFDVDSFLPEKERFELAMALNNLMASPSFAPWMSGSPLDIDSILYRADGTPRHSIFYIAHLSEPERMFFVTLLLNEVVSWMRRQPGTTSLRALVYFDEVFGFLPPVAMPPSKRPLLTLLKQARAFGVGTVLVTQNPVDLDYKALSNAGTWFIGRLQSKQDQQRLLEGLQTASATGSASSTTLSESIGGLKSRVFLMNNVHEDAPVVFHTRWAMNYLRGPMTRAQLQTFASSETEIRTTPAETPHRPQGNVAEAPGATSGDRPALPPGLSERFVVPESALGDPQAIIYRSASGALATTRFVDRKHNIEAEETTLHILPSGGDFGGQDWDHAKIATADNSVLRSEPASETASFIGGLPPGCNTKDDAVALAKSLDEWLYRNRRLTLLFHEELNLLQRPDESREAFRGRVELAAREQRDTEIDAAADKIKRQIERLEDRRQDVLRSLSEHEDKYVARKQEELISLGETVLGMVFGRRRRLTTVATKRRMTSTARARVEALGDKEEDLQAEIRALEQEAEEAADTITHHWDATVASVSTTEIAPRKSDVTVEFTGVLWLPFVVDQHGVERPAF